MNKNSTETSWSSAKQKSNENRTVNFLCSMVLKDYFNCFTVV